MIGCLRLFFALLVMAEHLGPEWWWAYHFGHWAVRGFYVISGYFAVASVSKGIDFRQFMQGRLLRILPAYWVVLAASLAVIWPWDIAPFHPMMIPPSPVEFFKNAVLWVEYGRIDSFPVVQAWALPVIVFWNALIALGLFKTVRQTVIFLGLFLALGQVLPLSYFSVLGGAVPFAVGALLYLVKVPIPNSRGTLPTIAANLSYPLFLVHYLVGAVIWLIFGIDRSWPLFVAALPPTLALSWLLWRSVDVPVNRYRQRLKSSTP